jgi:hypothetical protein
MKRHISALRQASAIGVSLAFLASPAAAASSTPTIGGPPSSAFGVDAHLVVDDIQSQFGPVAYVQASSSGPYDDKVSVGRENDVIALYPVNPAPSLFVFAQGMNSEVQSNGIEIDSVSTASQSAIGSISLSLNLNPPPPGPTPLPLLNIMATGVRSNVNYSQVFPSEASASSGAGFHTLTIIGSAIGGATLNYSGKAKPNTVIYETPNVTITLNKQIRTGIISCAPGCTFTLTSVTTVAVDVTLYKATWYGHKITGDIALGESHVQSQ